MKLTFELEVTEKEAEKLAEAEYGPLWGMNLDKLTLKEMAEHWICDLVTQEYENITKYENITE